MNNYKDKPIAESSLTPETDAATHSDWSGGAEATEPEVAHKLELERDQARRELESEKERHILTTQLLVEMQRERDEARKERDDACAMIAVTNMDRDQLRARVGELENRLAIISSDMSVIADVWLKDQPEGIQMIVKNVRRQAIDAALKGQE